MNQKYQRFAMRFAVVAVVVCMKGKDAHAQFDKSIVVIGPGTQLCSRFLEQYRKDPEYVEVEFFSWAQGFMSATNFSAMVRYKSGSNLLLWSVPRQKEYIRNYCITKPGLAYYTGVLDLFDAMRREQGLPPAR